MRFGLVFWICMIIIWFFKTVKNSMTWTFTIVAIYITCIIILLSRPVSIYVISTAIKIVIIIRRTRVVLWTATTISIASSSDWISISSARASLIASSKSDGCFAFTVAFKIGDNPFIKTTIACFLNCARLVFALSSVLSTWWLLYTSYGIIVLLYSRKLKRFHFVAYKRNLMLNGTAYHHTAIIILLYL